MEDKLINELDQIIKGEKPEKRRDEIIYVITKIHQELHYNEREITADAMTLLDISAGHLFETKTQNLLMKTNDYGLRFYLFVLAAKSLKKQEFLNKEANNPQKLKDDRKSPGSVKKLISRHEEMIKLTQETKTETLRSNSASLNELRSTTWRTINQVLKQCDKTSADYYRADRDLMKEL